MKILKLCFRDGESEYPARVEVDGSGEVTGLRLATPRAAPDALRDRVKFLDALLRLKACKWEHIACLSSAGRAYDGIVERVNEATAGLVPDETDAPSSSEAVGQQI